MKQLYLQLLAATILIAAQSYAQPAGLNIFLQGNHLEVGVGALGYFGSDSAAPPGYHPHLGPQLGFVADPYLTGWSTSTATDSSHYFGDYFLPGLPFEGWEMQVNGENVQAFNPYNFLSSGLCPCYGSNFASTSSGGVATGTWQGMVDSIAVTQVTTIDSGALYFMVEVTLTNMSSTPFDSIYYLRTLDPDNDESWGGSFATNNNAYNSGDTNVVTATGTLYPTAYMALGSTITPGVAFIYESWPLNTTIDLKTVLNETMGGATYTGESDGDYAIGLLMLIPHLASVDSAGDSVYRTTSTAIRHPANQATLKYFYSFSPAATNQALAAIANSDSTASSGGNTGLNVNNVNSTVPITVYPNPSSDVFYVTGLSAGDHVTVYDMMGRQALPTSNALKEGTNIFHYGDYLPASGYLVVVTDVIGHLKANVPVVKK